MVSRYRHSAHMQNKTYIIMRSSWARWRLKSPASPLLTQLLFRRRSKKTSKLCVTGLCVGNSPVTGEFPAQMASNAEYILHLVTSSCVLKWSLGISVLPICKVKPVKHVWLSSGHGRYLPPQLSNMSPLLLYFANCECECQSKLAWNHTQRNKSQLLDNCVCTGVQTMS